LETTIFLNRHSITNDMVGPITKAVDAVCKNCGKSYPSTEFSLDPVYKMMVCKKCTSERRMKESGLKQGSTAVPTASQPRPVITAALAQPKRPVVSSSNKTKERCKKCSFSFVYDAEKCYPQNCPNCGTPIKSGYSFF